MRQVFGEWGVVTETKSTSYGILSAPVASTIRGYLILCQRLFGKVFCKICITFLWTYFQTHSQGMFSTYILSQLEISFLRIDQANIR